MSSSAARSPLLPPVGWLDDPDADFADGHPGWPFLLVMTLLGAVLRLWRLDGASLWVDEVMTWRMVAPGQDLVFWQQVREAIQGPVYLVVVWPLLRIADTVFLLRLPAALAGIATVPIFGLAAGRILPRPAARLAVLLLAVNPFHIWYSQEARGYTLAVLAAVVLALIFLDALRRGLTPGRGLAMAILAALGIGSSMSLVFLWAAMALTVPLAASRRRPADLAGWAAVFAGGLLLAAPWLSRALGIWAVDRVVPGAAVGEALRGETTFSPLALPFTLFSHFFGYSLGPSLRELHGADRLAALRSQAPLLLSCGVAVAVPLFAGLFRWPRNRWWVLLWILVPLAAVVLLALRNIKPFNPRYVMVALPWLLLIVAHGLAVLPRRAGIAATVLLLGLTLTSLGGYYAADRYAKADVRAAAARVGEANAAGDPIFVPVVAQVFRYYHDGSGEVVGAVDMPPIRTSTDARALVALKLAEVERAWVVLAREWYNDPGDRLTSALTETGRLELVTMMPGVRVFQWERRPHEVEPEAVQPEGEEP